jgi:hypothetical protein
VLDRVCAPRQGMCAARVRRAARTARGGRAARRVRCRTAGAPPCVVRLRHRRPQAAQATPAEGFLHLPDEADASRGRRRRACSSRRMVCRTRCLKRASVRARSPRIATLIDLRSTSR